MNHKYGTPMVDREGNGSTPVTPCPDTGMNPQIPECFPRTYAAAFVLFQQPGDVYEPMEGLRNGTIFPELNMPYQPGRLKNG